jgi:hypothetical protein
MGGCKIDYSSKDKDLISILNPAVEKLRRVTPSRNSSGHATAFPVLSIGSKDVATIVSVLSALGEERLTTSDPLSNLIPSLIGISHGDYAQWRNNRVRNLVEYYDSRKNIQWRVDTSSRSQTHFPLKERYGLSFYLSLNCTGNCGDSSSPATHEQCPAYE